MAGGATPDSSTVAAAPPGEVQSGDRVRVDGAHATVRWVGTLPDKGAQIWVGVEFDDGKRGKHDGSRDGVQYFTAKSKTAGSFVKVEKVDRGISLGDALLGRFDGAGEDVMTSAIEDCKTGKVKDMTLVGFDKVVERQAKLELLEQVKLLDAGVSFCGDLGACPNLKALLLEQCLLSSWVPVAEMLSRLPSLRTLSLADTRIGPVRGDLAGVGHAQLQVLVLSNSGVSWEDCAPLQQACPQLEDLFLRSNGLGLPPADLRWPGVKNLILDDNGISDWGVLSAVNASFPDLVALQLNNNALEDDMPETVVAPASLTGLSLANNLIRSYSTIGRLCGCAPLGTQITGIRLADNPLSIDVNFRQLIVALMPQLTELNGSAVRARERVNGERTLLSLDVQGKAVAAEVDPDGSHRARLRAVHGDGIAGAEEVGNLGTSLVQIEIVPAAADILGKPSVTKKVPVFLDISEFKVLCHKLFKSVPLDNLRLVFREEGAVVATELVAGDLRAYGITNGAQVQVQDTREDYENKGA